MTFWQSSGIRTFLWWRFQFRGIFHCTIPRNFADFWGLPFLFSYGFTGSQDDRTSCDAINSRIASSSTDLQYRIKFISIFMPVYNPKFATFRSYIFYYLCFAFRILTTREIILLPPAPIWLEITTCILPHCLSLVSLVKYCEKEYSCWHKQHGFTFRLFW